MTVKILRIPRNYTRIYLVYTLGKISCVSLWWPVSGYQSGEYVNITPLKTHSFWAIFTTQLILRLKKIKFYEKDPPKHDSRDYSLGRIIRPHLF